MTRDTVAPWVILNRMRVHIKVFSDGRLLVDPGAGSADDATNVEKCLVDKLGAARIPHAQVQRRQGVISFGKWRNSAAFKAGKAAAAGPRTFW